jgi:hypothetical protein
MAQSAPCLESRNLTRASSGLRYARCGYVPLGPDVAMTATRDQRATTEEGSLYGGDYCCR